MGSTMVRCCIPTISNGSFSPFLSCIDPLCCPSSSEVDSPGLWSTGPL